MRINIVQVTNKLHPQASVMYYLCHDLVQIILFALEDLGHDVIFQKDTFEPDRLTIVVIGSNLNVKEIDYLKRSNLQYIVYQTEIFSPLGLNNDNPAMVRPMMEAQNKYLSLLDGAIHVWDCFKFNQVFLQERGIASSFIQHGYHSALEGRKKKTVQDIDVVFFGSHTEYRTTIFKRLLKEGLSLRVLNFEPPAMRDDVLRRAKVNLSIKANPTTMAHLPHSRIMTGLYQNTMTVSDPVYGQEWLHQMMDIVPTEELTNHIQRIIQDGSYIQKSETYSQMYRAHLMVDFMRPLMEELQEIINSQP